MKFWLEFFS